MTSKFSLGEKQRMIFICISKESSLVILPKQRMFVGKFWDGNCQILPKESFPTYKQEESSFSTSDHVNMLKASESGLAPQDNILLNSVFSRRFCLEKKGHIDEMNTQSSRHVSNTHKETR